MVLMEQGFVGGTTFLTSLLIGRFGGPEELGMFSLGLSAVFIVLAFQESLITTPYTIYFNGFSNSTRPVFRGSVLVHYAVLVVVASTLFVLLAGALAFEESLRPFATVTLALAVVIPFWLLRELGRRIAFAELDVRRALLLGGAVAVLQLSLLAILSARQMLTAASGFCAIAVACGVGGCGWFYLHRSDYRIRRSRIFPAFKKNATIGKWFLAVQGAVIARGYVVPWLIALLFGTAGTGIFAACATLMRVANLLITAVRNMLIPKISYDFAAEGAQGMRRVVWKATCMLALFTTPYCALIAICGGSLLSLLFGDEYSGHHATIVAVAFRELATAIGMASEDGLTVAGYPQVILCAEIFGFVVTLVTAFALMTDYDVLGAAIGYLAGGIATTAMTVSGYYFIVVRKKVLLSGDPEGTQS